MGSAKQHDTLSNIIYLFFSFSFFPPFHFFRFLFTFLLLVFHSSIFLEPTFYIFLFRCSNPQPSAVRFRRRISGGERTEPPSSIKENLECFYVSPRGAPPGGNFSFAQQANIGFSCHTGKIWKVFSCRCWFLLHCALRLLFRVVILVQKVNAGLWLSVRRISGALRESAFINQIFLHLGGEAC